MVLFFCNTSSLVGSPPSANGTGLHTHNFVFFFFYRLTPTQGLHLNMRKFEIMLGVMQVWSGAILTQDKLAPIPLGAQ